MEEFAGLIPVIIVAIISALAKSEKNKTRAQQHPNQQPTAPVQTQPAAPVTPPPAQLSMADMLPPTPITVAQPTVHTHVQPDCETHDAPESGSLGVRSTEGKDPCHEEQFTQRDAMPSHEAAPAPRPLLDFSGDAMVRAFVMQEVLTRPCDRRR